MKSSEISSTHIVTAVHVQNVTGNVRSHRRRQEKNGVDYFIRLAETAQRNLFGEVLRYFMRHALAHSDIDEAGRNSVNRDLVSGQLACRNLGQRDDGSLARRVVSLPEQSHLSANG